jgi:hypothetical protein
MCMIDCADETCVVLHCDTRKARKEHRCVECGRTISKAEKYTHEAVIFDGKVDVYKTCRHCMVVRRWLSAECGGWLYQGVHEDIHEHVIDGFYGKGVIMLDVGMERQWRKRDGSLWRVPSVPKTSHERAAA